MARHDAASSVPVVFAGVATLDAIALTSRFPGPDERQVAEDVTYAGGGTAATAAVAAARLGQPAAFVGAVGDDAEGERILEGLRAEGVDVTAVTTARGQRSGASVIVVDHARGTRAICSRPAPALDIPRDSPAAELLGAAAWVHTDHVGWGPVDAFFRSQPSVRKRPRASVDAGNSIPGLRPDAVDFYVPTVEALRQAYGDGEPADLVDAALADGARCVVATDGANGVVVGTQSGQRYGVPARRVEVVSTLGAGDVFHGALVAAAARDMPLRTCVSYATVAAGLSCRALDGRSGIPGEAEIRTHLAEDDGVTASLADPVRARTARTAVVIPTARPTFAVDTAREHAAAARALLEDLGARVTGPDDLVMTPEDVETAAGYVDPDADLVVHVCASFSDASPAPRLYSAFDRPVLLWAFREPGPVGDRLWLNSLCGANLFGHALVRAGGEVRLLYGNPDELEVRDTLRRALDGELPPAVHPLNVRRERADAAVAREALESLRGRRIGLVGEAPAGFTPCEYDGHRIERLFGVQVEEIPVARMVDRAAAVGEADRDRERAAASALPGLDRLHGAEVDRAAAAATALRRWAGEGELAAVAVRCWPEFPAEFGTCPCFALSRLADAGTPTACERDVYGALTMLLLEALGAGMSYLVDTVDLDAGRNVVRMWHCGSAATSLAADPAAAAQDVHCNRRIGVAGNFPLRPGPVVVSRLADDPDPRNPTGLRLLLTGGESLPEPNRFQGNTAAVLVQPPAVELVHGLVTGGFPHHTVLAWRDVRPQLRAVADLLDMPVVEW